MSQIYDITIIGGGPVGLYAAFYAGMRQAKTKIIESLDLLGGQPAHLYPEKAIYDIPAHYQIKGGDLTQSLIQQLDHFDTTICTGQEARQLIQHEDEDGNVYECAFFNRHTRQWDYSESGYWWDECYIQANLDVHNLSEQEALALVGTV